MLHPEAWMQDFFDKKADCKHLRHLRTDCGEIDFFSNDYLGVSKNKIVKRDLLAKLADIEQLGSTGSRLLSGNSNLAMDTEQYIANFFSSQAALFFISGFSLNIGLISALASDSDIVLLDERIHASWVYSAKLSKAKVYYFKHNMFEQLASKLNRLKKLGPRSVYVVIETLYSMDGDFAPLREIVDVCKSFGASLIVDEAHAAGICGKRGGGFAVELGLDKEIFCRVVTFGKAFGASGAVLLSSSIVKKYLVNFCSSFIYTTAPSAYVYLNISCIIENFIIGNFSINREDLKFNIHEFNKLLGVCNKSPIFPFVFNSVEKLYEVYLKLKNMNIACMPIYSPSVRRGQERLRVCLHSFNTKQQLNILYEILICYEKFWEKNNLCYRD